jgi:hypothetical protein
MRKSTIALVAAGLLGSTPALADRYDHPDPYRNELARADSRATIHALKKRDDELQRQSDSAMRIGAVERRDIAMQRNLIDDVVDRLERGERVDRYALDRAFEYPGQAGYTETRYHDFERGHDHDFDRSHDRGPDYDRDYRG